MTNKKLALTCLTMIIILIAPSINAISVNKTTNESIKPEDTGTIYGWTGYCHWPGYTPVSFVRVWMGTRFTISDLYGDFSISGLPLDHQYTVYYTRWDYVTKSEKVYLSSSEPNEEVSLMFNVNDKRSTNDKSKSPEETTGLSSVYGNVAYGHRPGYTAVPFARVWIGSKWDICDLQGAFNISGLPVERQYTMYYTAIGFVTKSLEVYIMSQFPHKKVWPGFTEDDRIKSKSTEKINLFFYHLISKKDSSLTIVLGFGEL